MVIKREFLTFPVDGTTMVVATGDEVFRFNGVAKANETAAFLLELLKQEQTEESLVSSVVAKYEVSKEDATKDVYAFLSQLREIGALNE